MFYWVVVNAKENGILIEARLSDGVNVSGNEKEV